MFLPDSITLIQSSEQTSEQQSALCKEVPITTQGGGFVPHPWTMLTNNLDFHAHLPPHHGEISRPICVQWLLKEESSLNHPWHCGKIRKLELREQNQKTTHKAFLYLLSLSAKTNFTGISSHRNFQYFSICFRYDWGQNVEISKHFHRMKCSGKQRFLRHFDVFQTWTCTWLSCPAASMQVRCDTRLLFWPAQKIQDFPPNIHHQVPQNS